MNIMRAGTDMSHRTRWVSTKRENQVNLEWPEFLPDEPLGSSGIAANANPNMNSKESKKTVRQEPMEILKWAPSQRHERAKIRESP